MDAAALCGGQGSAAPPSPPPPPPPDERKTDEAGYTSPALPCFLYSQSNLIPDWLSEEPGFDGT